MAGVTTALVTGAARGLGAALTEALVGAGIDVILVDRDPGIVARADALLCEAIVCDLTTEVGLTQVTERLDGTVGILINNAGAARRGSLIEQAPASIESLVRLNVTVPAILAQRFVASCPPQPACLVFVSSSMAIAPTPMLGTYGASKAFQTSLAEALDVEARLGELGEIRVLCVEPSGMVTGFQEAAGVQHADSSFLLDPADVADKIVAEILHGRRRARPFLRIGLTGKALAVGRRVLPRRVFTRTTGRLLARFR